MGPSYIISCVKELLGCGRGKAQQARYLSIGFHWKEEEKRRQQLATAAQTPALL
jgi:hypothetical protein